MLTGCGNDAVTLYLGIGILLILFRISYVNKNESSKLATYLKNKSIIIMYLIGLFILFPKIFALKYFRNIILALKTLYVWFIIYVLSKDKSNM